MAVTWESFEASPGHMLGGKESLLRVIPALDADGLGSIITTLHPHPHTTRSLSQGEASKVKRTGFGMEMLLAVSSQLPDLCGLGQPFTFKLFSLSLSFLKWGWQW